MSEVGGGTNDPGDSDDVADAGDAAASGRDTAAGAGDTAAGSDAGRTPVTQQVGRVAVVVVALLFVVFAVANAQHVDFSWVFGGTEVVAQGGERASGGVRLIVLLLVAFAAGACVAGILAWQRARHRD